MRKDLTEIVMVVDRSGSMVDIQQEAEKGINAFITDQQKQPGEANLTLVQFDTEYEFVHRGTPLKAVRHYTLEPRGCTALLDAVGRAIAETGQRLEKMSEASRPGLVMFVITTDGLENSSHEYTREQVRAMIQHQQDKYAWQFTFLAANQDAFATGAGMGIAMAQSANVAPARYTHAFYASTANVSRMRSSTMAGESVSNAYTTAERAAMDGTGAPLDEEEKDDDVLDPLAGLKTGSGDKKRVRKEVV